MVTTVLNLSATHHHLPGGLRAHDSLNHDAQPWSRDVLSGRRALENLS